MGIKTSTTREIVLRRNYIYARTQNYNISFQNRTVNLLDGDEEGEEKEW